MIISVLTENTSKAGLPVEHGLSLFIETAGKHILFDTGQTDLFAENAKQLGLDLEQADLAVISHGHYDHGGGLGRFLRENDHAPVYLSKYAFERHFNAEGKDIGLDPGLLESGRLVLADKVTDIGSGLTLYSCNDRKKNYDMGPSGLGMMEDEKIVEDDFRHEQYLLAEEKGKRILFSGCSHKGILNIMEWFRPDVLIGGFHLFRHPVDDKLQIYARQLDAYECEYYTCHCTGTEQYEYMRPFMKHLHYISAGMKFEI